MANLILGKRYRSALSASPRKHPLYRRETATTGRRVCRQVPSSSARPPTLVNIGTNPTVGNRGTTVEGYMLEVAGDVYGQQLCFRGDSCLQKTLIQTAKLQNE